MKTFLQLGLRASAWTLAGWIGAACTALAAPPDPVPAPDPALRLTQYVHDVWQTDDGLPANDVLGVVHGRDGYLWLATRGGLARFDGLRFEVFNMVSTAAFASDDFGALVEGPDGSLWIGSRGAGVYRYRQGLFTSHRSSTAAGNDVRALLVDRSGTLWAGTLGGLHRLVDGELEAVAAPALEGTDVRALFEDTDGTLWVGTGGRGLFRMRQSGVEAVAVGGLSHPSVRAVLRDRTGVLWVATADGLNRLAGGGVRVYRRADGLLDDRLEALHEDAAGSLWIGTDSGLARLRDGRLEGLELRAGVAADLVRAVTVDREGNLWFGSYGSGLHRLKAGPVTPLSEREGLSHNGVWSITGTAAGELLVGFGAGGVDRVRDGTASPFTAFDLPRTDVYSLLEDRRGVLWAGTGGGLLRHDGDSTRTFTTADGLPDDRVRIVLEDPSEPGRLWLGTFGGVAGLRAGVITHPAGAPGPGVNVRALLVDRSGALWIGTESGLTRLADGEPTVFTTADGLGGNAIRALYEDAAGVLWIGTRGGGLSRLAGGEITAYTTRQGLPHNDVWAILEDGDGNLWWSSDQGLTRARKADFEAYDRGRLAAVVSRSFGRADGLKVVECNGVGYPSAWKSEDGRLHFASMGGVASVDPRPPAPQQLPPVYVESLVAGDEPVDLSGPIELEPERRNLELVYTSPQLRDPGRARFRYRLSPYDRDWVEAGARRSAFYTNLPPGAYEFRVVAGRAGGGWSDEGAAVAFDLAPHVWETWWFYVACAALLGLAVLQGHRLLTRGIRTRNERLRREVARRRQVEKALRASEAKFATVYRASPDAMVLSSLTAGTFLDVNEVFLQLTGYRRDEVIGRTSIEIDLWADLDDRRRIAEILGRGEMARDVETKLRGKSGETFTCHISSGLIEIEGRPAVVSVIRDARELKRAERERERLIRELEAKNDELERFTYTVSHDLKAPLVTIKGFLGFLRRDVEAGERERVGRDVERIESAAGKMHVLLENLLELSRVGRQTNPPEEVPFGEVVREAAEAVAGALGERGVELVIEDGLPAVTVDRARLVEALQNLLENAVRYMGDQAAPRIEVGRRRDGPDDVFTVRDNGIGIEPQYHPKIFELFERLDAEAEGTGVGLALVQRIVEIHGGRVWVESEGLGHGSTFCFTLPGNLS